MARDLLIVGGGVAGLAAGCYAAKSGHRTTILEMGRAPGGLCTSWYRKGYRFDASVAGLAGNHPSLPIYRLSKRFRGSALRLKKIPNECSIAVKRGGALHSLRCQPFARV